MKRSIIALTLLIPMLVPVTASAAPVTKIAIIDSYFNASQIAGPVTSLCVADRGCSLTATNTGSAVFSHGTSMAQIIRRYNPTAHLVLIRAGSIVGSTVYDANGREISNGFLAVPADAEVVSISIYSNGNGTLDGTGCRPSTQTMTGVVNVSLELSRATSAVNAIASRGTVIVGAAGNANRPKGLNYPACLYNVQAVTGPWLTGTSNPNTDIYIEVNGESLGGTLSTTSGSTAYVASVWDLYAPIVKLNTFNRVPVLKR